MNSEALRLSGAAETQAHCLHQDARWGWCAMPLLSSTMLLLCMLHFPAGSCPDCSSLYTAKWIVQNLSSILGPLISIVFFVWLGNTWEVTYWSEPVDVPALLLHQSISCQHTACGVPVAASFRVPCSPLPFKLPYCAAGAGVPSGAAGWLVADSGSPHADVFLQR